MLPSVSGLLHCSLMSEHLEVFRELINRRKDDRERHQPRPPMPCLGNEPATVVAVTEEDARLLPFDGREGLFRDGFICSVP